MEQFFTGIIGITLGIIMMKYGIKIYGFTGKFWWAEKIFGHWGTATAIKLMGFILLCYSIVYIFWWEAENSSDILLTIQ